MKKLIIILVMLLSIWASGAVKYWDGSVDGCWIDGNNWSGDTKPVNDDECIFDSGATQDVDANIGVTDTGALSLDLLHVKTGFTGDLGTSSYPLHIQPDTVIIEGTGTYYIECAGQNDTNDADIDLVIVNNKDATVYLTSTVNTSSWTAYFTEVVVLAGTVHIGEPNDTVTQDTWVATLRIMPAKAGDATVDIKEDCVRLKATAATMSIYMGNGTCTSDSAALLIEQYKGTFNYGTDLAASPEAGVDIGTLKLHSGTFNWYPDDSGDPCIGMCWLYGGTFEASGTTNNDRYKQLGLDATGKIYVFDDATLNMNNNRSNISIGASAELYNIGGTISFDNFTKLSIEYDIP